jgi:signal transduction histidine kinase
MQEIEDNTYLLMIIGMFGSALLVVSFILINIRNRNKLLRHQRKAQESALQHQVDLLHATINSQEEERKRIGIDLHDEVGSALSTLRMYIQRITEEKDSAKAEELRTRSKDLIDNIIINTRNIAHDLSPITDGAYNIMDALEDLCSLVNQAGKPEIQFTFSRENILSHLDLNHALALYRVIRELIKNTITHANARFIYIDIKDDDGEIILTYRDDGKGFLQQDAPRGMGMNNIESRLAMIRSSWQIATAPGQGFEIAVRLPAK